jgi:protein-tyrosine phosphatase
MSTVLAWRRALDARGLALHVARALGGGSLVALPTETGYALAGSATNAEAFSRLVPNGVAPTLALPAAGAACDWAPGLSGLGRRLVRRGWPGPLELVFGGDLERGLVGRLPEAARSRLCGDGALRLWVPEHDAAAAVLQQASGPLVFAGIAEGAAPPRTADEAAFRWADLADLVIDAGPSALGTPSTAVRVDGEQWRVVREGAVGADVIAGYAAAMVVFVCTGNTCRSPLAEALCKKKLADGLGCAVDELPGRGFVVLSAGLAAMMGEPAAAEAVAVARAYGAALDGHYSRPVTATLLSEADLVLTMTRGHLTTLSGTGAPAGLLAPGGEDIADPIGAGAEVYEACARQIWESLDSVVASLLAPPKRSMTG